MGYDLCKYHLIIWSNFNLLHNSQRITFPPQLCLVLYSFYANLLYSIIMRVTISFLSPHNLHLFFCYVFSIFPSVWLVLMALFSAAIKRDSVSFLKFHFLNHVKVFSLSTSPVCLLKYPYICFSSNFRFLVFVAFLFVLILLLDTVISFSLLFLMDSLISSIDTSISFSMLGTRLPPCHI